MAKKTFTTYAPVELPELEMANPSGATESFRIQPVPGAILLDFLSGVDQEDPAAMAKTVHALISEAIHPEDLERWNSYIRDRANNVDLNTLSEVAGYISEVAASGNPHQRPVSSLTG